MTMESVEPGLIHSGSRIPSPAPAAGTKPQPGKNSPRGESEMLHPRRPIFWMRPANHVPAVEAAPGTSARALASEIEAQAARFAAAGEDASIDLRFLKAMPSERESLASLLGRGEISAVVNALGRTEIHETAIPCVWWIRHHNDEGDIVGELIEVTTVPEIITGDRLAVARGLEAFRTARSAQTALPYHDAR